jgi:hypothetical protein
MTFSHSFSDIFIEENHLVHENLIRIRESQDSKLY